MLVVGLGFLNFFAAASQQLCRFPLTRATACSPSSLHRGRDKTRRIHHTNTNPILLIRGDNPQLTKERWEDERSLPLLSCEILYAPTPSPSLSETVVLPPDCVATSERAASRVSRHRNTKVTCRTVFTRGNEELDCKSKQASSRWRNDK